MPERIPEDEEFLMRRGHTVRGGVVNKCKPGQGVQEIEPAVENVPAAHGLDEWPLDTSLAKHLLRSSEAAQVTGQ